MAAMRGGDVGELILVLLLDFVENLIDVNFHDKKATPTDHCCAMQNDDRKMGSLPTLDLE